uniref:Uncharacterized protein n=1 Tax=Eccles virus TaxID=2170578 RepID=A0A2S0S4H4_9REOV|nr:hypothetical protein [Eccles virus]
MSSANVLSLWNYLPSGSSRVSCMLNNMIQDINLPSVQEQQLALAFGFRLKRLFTVGKQKFHPLLLTKLQTAKKCGLFLFSTKAKNNILSVLHAHGWSRSVKVHFIKQFPSANYFDVMLDFDIIVFREGRIPVEIDVYFLDLAEKETARQRGLLFSNHNPFMLDTKIRTNIASVNLFSKLDVGRPIIGIGGKLKGFEDWYIALERFSTETLFDAMDQVQLKSVATYFAGIGCLIPSCVLEAPPGVRYWHNHYSILDPGLSAQNLAKGKEMTMIEFGGAYRVAFVFEDEKIYKCSVQAIVYNFFFLEDGKLRIPGVDDVLFFLSRSAYSSVTHPLRSVGVKECRIECKVPMLSNESYQMVFEQLFLGMLKNRAPNLVLISPKGSLKTTFAEFVRENSSGVLIIDSDEFLELVGIEYHKLYPFANFNAKDGIILNWFRQRLDRGFEIPITHMTPDSFSLMMSSSVLLAEFNTFWASVFDKGIGEIPSYQNFINQKTQQSPGVSLAIILVHNIFEARLSQSKFILTVDCGVDTDDILTMRAIRREQTVSQYISQLLYQRFCQVNEQLHSNVVGWGDVLALLMNLGILRDGVNRESVH